MLKQKNITKNINLAYLENFIYQYNIINYIEAELSLRCRVQKNFEFHIDSIDD